MSADNRSPRRRLIRDVAVFQIKLFVDGLRDAILIPVSLLAALIGVLRGGEDADREFRQVLQLGQRSEHWIGLFGRRGHFGRSSSRRSIDHLLERVENAVMEQYRKGKNTDEVRAAITAALAKKDRDEDKPGPE